MNLLQRMLSNGIQAHLMGFKTAKSDMHLIDTLSKPIIFAHRGASKFAPENTLAAFDLALSLGAPAIELDTMLSRDRIPIVIHDNTLARTTNGNGKVADFHCEELSLLDAGSSFSPLFKGELIPTLEDVLTRYKNKLLINIELKNYHAPFDHLPHIVAELINKLDMSDTIIVSSFLPWNLLIIKRLNPDIKIALLVDPSFFGQILSSEIFSFLSPEFIHPHSTYITSHYLEHEHKLKRRVNTWTVNDPMLAKKFFAWKMDGLISDDPQAMLRILDETTAH